MSFFPHEPSGYFRILSVSQDEIGMEDAILCDNGPKEISIFCHEAPEIKIVDLSQDHRGNNECL